MTVVYHPRLAMGCDRITELQRAANIMADLANARAMIRDEQYFGEPALRWACSTLETYGNADDYLIADQMIHVLNIRAKMPAQATETPEDVLASMQDKLPEIMVAAGIVATAILAATGWIF